MVSGCLRLFNPARTSLGNAVLTLSLVVSGLVGTVQGQESYIRSWHIEDGLPDANVTAIQQTPDGYLWVGTPQGLVRFDGAQFKVFETSRAPGNPELHVSALLVDRAGVLWVGCESGNLYRLERGQLRAVALPGQSGRLPAAGFVQDHQSETGKLTRWMWGEPTELAEDEEGAVWSVIAGKGLVRCQGEKSAFFTASNGVPAGEIGGLCSDNAGHLWLASGDVLYRRSEGQWACSPGAEPLGGPLARLAPARQGGIWAAAPRGSWVHGGGLVRRFAGQDWVQELEPTPLTPNSLRSQVTTVLEDRAGRVWLGMLWNGIFYSENGGKWRKLQSEGPLSQCVITCLFEDRQGSLWVGTGGEGLHRITRRPVTVLKLPPPAQENIITTSCAARDGSLWVGTDGAGAFRYSNEVFVPFGAQAGLTEQHVCSIFQDRQTNLWFGTWGGLFRFNAGRFTRVDGPTELGLSVLAMFEDRAGRLWVGTPRGLVCRQGKEWSVHPLLDQDAYLDIRSLAEDSAGNLWVGTIGQGLFRLRDNQITRFRPEHGFSSLNARSLFCDTSGVVWIGTDGAGLFRFKDDRFAGYTTADGLPCKTISSILPDADGNLWMGSDNGIFACAPQRVEAYERGRSPTFLFTRLTPAEGLGSRGCSGSGQPVALRSADGRLWFPNMRGLAVFDPRPLITAHPQATSVLVESVAVDGAEVGPEPGGELRVRSSARRFEFHYTAPELLSPQLVRFRHKLEGMDDDWVEGGGHRTAYYSQLPPGDYRFRVMAGGTDGQWHEAATPLLLRVVPRFWELRWVRVLAGMLLVGVVSGSVVLNERRKVRRKLERFEMQQALESERRRIARDLHDDLGAHLTEIVLLGELAKRGEQSTSSLQNQVGGITQKVRQLVTAMEEVVWTVNPKNDTLPNLAAFLSDYMERFLAPTPISCRFDFEDTLPEVALTAHTRHNLLLAFKEALNNAVRHSAAARLSLGIHVERGGAILSIEVADDGRGFAPQESGKTGNGLQNMRARMESVGGTAEVRSEPGQGTVVRFLLPLTAGIAL